MIASADYCDFSALNHLGEKGLGGLELLDDIPDIVVYGAVQHQALVARFPGCAPPDGTTSHSTKPASGQVAGYPQPSPSRVEGANVTPKPTNAPWPFGKEIRAQCGGVRGLAEAMDSVSDETTDIAAAVLLANDRFGGSDAFPYSEIMRAVVHYEPRKRHR